MSRTKKTDGKPPVRVTPMMAQFIEIKAANPDCLLFYRMGDFYELFFEDAVLAAQALGIVLTKRGKHLGEDIPMCGVPVRRADEYLHKLIRAGFRVAVCEQTEDPQEAKKRKSVVRREVRRLVTNGTIIEDALLDARKNNYLAALHQLRGGEMAIAYADISTGEFSVRETKAEMLQADLAQLAPGEILTSDKSGLAEHISASQELNGAQIMVLPGQNFDSSAAKRRLKSQYDVAALDAYGDFNRAELGAAGALLGYIEMTQAGHLPALKPPRREHPGATMMIDAATRSNLELTQTLKGELKGSLLDIIDMSVTGAGGREITARLTAPLTSPELIHDRLDSVGFFAEDASLREDIRASLKACPDMARALGRLSLDRGGPRDLLAVRGALAAALSINSRFSAGTDSLTPPPRELADALAALDKAGGDLKEMLDAALDDEAPLMARDGGFIAAGYSGELDKMRKLRDESRRVIAGLQADYAKMTGIKSLKVRHNNMLGYFIEVTSQHGEKLLESPFNETFIHRQTHVKSLRFTTVELSETEARISRAGDQAMVIEIDIFEKLSKEVEAERLVLDAIVEALAAMDAAAALGELAVVCGLTRPKVDDSRNFQIKRGRHPVVERALDKQGGHFIANDCSLDPENENSGCIWLLTGPNMAGKSTFLRQNALIAIMAQMGSFVPAESAHIGIADRLFSRVGAADDLARGRSTFMVEMVETAVILNQAGPRSLVILDEIGRGTATFDGLSIAWACVEHLHEENHCRALFATHFHELTALSEKLTNISNATMRVKEWGHEIMFLHEVTPGAADRSYGIQVAKLAGLPPAVVERASEVLAALEKTGQRETAAALADDLPLFSAARPKTISASPAPSRLEEELRNALPDSMTPREALDFIYRLKSLLPD